MPWMRTSCRRVNDYPSDLCDSDECPFEVQDRKDELMVASSGGGWL